MVKGIGNKILVLNNEAEANKAHEYLKEIIKRGNLFCRDLKALNELIPYTNVRYTGNGDKFNIYYSTQTFKSVNYGCTVRFYKPEWADMSLEFKNLKSVCNQYNNERNRMDAKIVIDDEVSFDLKHLVGMFKFVKEERGVNSFYFEDLVIDTCDKYEEMEELADYICGGGTLYYKIDYNAMGNKVRNCASSFFRVLQVNEHIKFNVQVDLHILDLYTFMGVTKAFDIVYGYSNWTKGVIRLNLNTNMRGKNINKTVLHKAVVYEGPHRLSFDGSVQMVKQCMPKSMTLTNIDVSKKLVSYRNRNNICYELYCNCLERKN